MVTTFMTIGNNYCNLWIGPLSQTLWIYNHKYNDLTVIISVTYGHTFYDHEDSNYFLTNSLIILVFFFFTRMSSVIVFAKYNSRWDETTSTLTKNL